MIIETNILEYMFTAIFSIMTKKKVYLVTFHSLLFKATKLHYDIYNKELLVVFKAFYTWCHYLEGLEWPIDIITDYKNLEYFSISKILSCHQVR